MALQPNKKNGKAVADIQALYFYNHATNGEPIIEDSLESEEWFPVLSLRGSVTASQDAPSIEKINVDQFDAPIGMTTEPGDFNFEATLPSLIAADLQKWLEAGANKIVMDGKEGYGYDLNGDIYDMSVLIKTRTGDIIIFSRAQVTITFAKEDKVFVLKASGQVEAPTLEENKMVYILADTHKADESSSKG